MLNDTISDLLTRLRNANAADHQSVSTVYTNMNYEIGKILKKEGYISGLTVVTKKKTTNQNPTKTLLFKLKYSNPLRPPITPCLQNVKRMSSPSLRVYLNYKEIPQVLNGMGILIISTSKGLMVDRDARSLKIGGEIICSVW